MWNIIRYKLRKRSAVALALICILILPTVYLENTEMPTSNENVFYLGMMNSSSKDFTLINNSSNYVSQRFLLLNHEAKPIANVNVSMHDNVRLCQKTRVGNHTDIYVYFTHVEVTSETNSFGFINVTSANFNSSITSQTKLRNTSAQILGVSSYSVSMNALEGGVPQKYYQFHFSSTTFKRKDGNITTVYFSAIPFSTLGYYGRTPVVLICNGGNPSNIFNISYKLWNPQNKGTVYRLVNLTGLRNHQLYLVRNLSLLKEFNEADNVTFYGPGNESIGNLFHPLADPLYFLDNITSSGSQFPAAYLALLVGFLMVLLIYTPMFDNNAYKRYLSLPEKRARTILIQIASTLVLSSMLAGIAFGISFILFVFLFHVALSLNALIFTYALIEITIFVFSSIFTMLNGYLPGRSRTTTLTAISLMIVAFLNYTISLNSLISLSQPAHIKILNRTFLFQPVLENIRSYNILTSILPIISVEQLNNYLLKFPFAQIYMYNHLNLIDLSPIISIASILVFSAVFIYLGIRKLKRI